MMHIEAAHGEMVFDCLERAHLIAKLNRINCTMEHNGTRIKIYHDSNIRDLAEKFDMQRFIDGMKA